MRTNFVVGYGSLMNPDSRAMTGVSSDAVPVWVSGYRRSWNFQSISYGMTALGVYPKSESILNSVLVRIADADLKLFDDREGVREDDGYDRVSVPSSNAMNLDGTRLTDSPLWIYVPKQMNDPNAQCPILQSYVDVVLSGCLQIGESFADEFVRTTDGWEGPWINDRAKPRYLRAAHAVAPANRIDQILHRNGAICRS